MTSKHEAASGGSEGSGGDNRRDFLRKSAAAALGASALGATNKGRGAERASFTREAAATIPPHDAIQPLGVHSYAERSLQAGERLHVCMSADVPYQMTVRRLGVRVDDRSTDRVLHTIQVAEPRTQPIHPGSYVHVPKGLASDKPLEALSLECWLRPWSLDRPQGVITQSDSAEGQGVGILIAGRGELAFHCGADAKQKAPCMLTAPFPKWRQWRHLVATWDGRRARLFIDGEKVAEAEFEARVVPAAGPLRLGAGGAQSKSSQFLDGDLAAPAIYGIALSEEAIAKRFRAAGLSAPPAEGLLACWPLDEERGSTVRDASGAERHGQIINRGTWMIGGPGYDATSPPRYGDYDPTTDPKRGHGLRFASDDLYDCLWQVDHEFEIPSDAAPGIYLAEAEFDREGKPYRYPITFVVRRAPSRPQAETLVLCATSTWAAYSSTPFAVNTAGPLIWGTSGIKNSHPEAPAYSCYRNHRAGQPGYQFGLQMPWPAAGPDVLYSPPEIGYAHLMRAERHLLGWLETEGHDFDVASDLDLHRQPALLEGRKVVILNGHSEYWSREAYEAVDGYLTRGGSLIVLSGNTMFWRATFDDEVMECRKFDDRIGGRPNAPLGEMYHTHDHRRGSLMRECGLPAWRVIGLDSAGWAGIDRIEEYVPLTVTDPEHPLFTTPTPTKLGKGDTFGHAADAKGPRAIGHEWDVRLSRLTAMTGKTPPGVTLPEEPAGIQTLATGIRTEGVTGSRAGLTALDYLTRPSKLIDGVRAEMIDWRRPTGGHVINFGAIGIGWALAADPTLQIVMRNALHACGVTIGRRAGDSA